MSVLVILQDTELFPNLDLAICHLKIYTWKTSEVGKERLLYSEIQSPGKMVD